jgi:hypothetical protein
MDKVCCLSVLGHVGDRHNNSELQRLLCSGIRVERAYLERRCDCHICSIWVVPEQWSDVMGAEPVLYARDLQWCCSIILQQKGIQHNRALPAIQLQLSIRLHEYHLISSALLVHALESALSAVASPPVNTVIRLLTTVSSPTDWVSWVKSGVHRKRNPKLICRGAGLIHYHGTEWER